MRVLDGALALGYISWTKLCSLEVAPAVTGRVPLLATAAFICVCGLMEAAGLRALKGQVNNRPFSCVCSSLY